MSGKCDNVRKSPIFRKSSIVYQAFLADQVDDIIPQQVIMAFEQSLNLMPLPIPKKLDQIIEVILVTHRTAHNERLHFILDILERIFP
jgi:hypothetical protein